MDIRHIKEVPPLTEDGSGLTRLFNLQTLLVERYMKVEKLPPYPVDLSIRKDQYLVKDFVGRVIEELAEAHESYLTMVELYESPPEAQVQGQEAYLPHLQNFNEEMADALHFFLETLLYVGITEEDIKEYLKAELVRKNLKEAFWYEGDDPLESLMQLAKHDNAQATLYYDIYRMAYKVIPDNEVHDEFMRGGRAISPAHVNVYAELSWEVTYHLSIARNFLKNKPWKRSEMTTDKKRFYRAIMQAWLAMFRIFDFAGMTSVSVFHIYFKKNCVNNFRIDSNY